MKPKERSKSSGIEKVLLYFLMILIYTCISTSTFAQMKVTIQFKKFFAHFKDGPPFYNSSHTWLIRMEGGTEGTIMLCDQRHGGANEEYPFEEQIVYYPINDIAPPRILIYFMAWESNNCTAEGGNLCTYDDWCIGHPDTHLAINDYNISLTGLAPNQELDMRTELFIGNELANFFEYTVKWEWERPFTVEKETNPENGGDGYCSGIDRVILKTQPNNLSYRFHPYYVWRIRSCAGCEPYSPPYNGDRLDLTNDPFVLAHLSEPLTVTVALKTDGGETPESAPLPIKVHQSPPRLTMEDINEITKENKGIAGILTDIEVQHVLCTSAETATVKIKSVSGGTGQYYFTLDGPITLNGTKTLPFIFPADASNKVKINQDGSQTEIKGLAAGEYTLYVENIYSKKDPANTDVDETSCYSSQTIIIKEPQRLAASVTKSKYHGFDVSCFDSANDAEITVTGSEGVPPYSYQLLTSEEELIGQVSDREGGYPFSNLNAFKDSLHKQLIDYKIKVFGFFHQPEQAGCEVIVYVPRLEVPKPLKIKGPWSSPATCFGTATGKIDLNTYGGVPPYRLNISKTDRPLLHADSTKLITFSNLYYGKYSINVTDTNNCHVIDSAFVDQPKKIIIDKDFIAQPLCFGGSDARYEVEATGGLPATKPAYQYTLAHKNVPKDKRLKFDSLQTQPIKRDPPLPLIPKADFTDLIAGDYEIRITDIANCQVEYPLYIGSPTKVEAIAIADSVQCKGDITGHITTALSGGTPPYVASWLDDNGKVLQTNKVSTSEIFNLTNRSGGEYKLHIEDDHACQIDTVSRIGFPQDSLKLSIASLHLQKDSCNDVTPGFVTLETSGGWRTLGNYQFSTDKRSYSPDNFFENLAPGNYKFYVKDGKGCTDSTRAEIPLGTDLQVLIDSTRMVSCYGDNNGFIRLNVFGGLEPYAISIDGGQTWQNEITYPDLPPNEYDVNVQDAGHCLYKIIIPVIEPDKLNVDLLSKQLSACNQSNGSINVNVKGGTEPYALKWFKDMQELVGETDAALQNITSGAYRLDVVDKNLCSKNIDVDISDERHPKVDTVITTPVTCYGSRDGIVEIGNITTSYSIPGYTVVYDYDTTYVYTMNNQPAGQHQLFIIDTEGCKLSRKVTIASPDSLHTGFIAFKHPTCYEGCDAHAEIEAHGGVGGYAYTWEPSQATTLASSISNACAGNYKFTLTDANGCELTENIYFKDPAAITANLPETITICPGKPLVLNAGNVGATYQWTSDAGFKSDEEQVALSSAGTYHLLIRTPQGCIGGDTLQLIVSSTLLEADFIISSYAAIGDTVVAIEISHPEPSSIDWQVNEDVIRFGSNGPVEEFIFSEEGTYTVALQASLDGCVDRKEQIIQVQPRGTVFTGDTPTNFLIKDVTLHPNPNQGHFTVEVTLFKEAPVSVEFMDVGTAHVLQSFTQEANDHYNLEFNVPNITQGVYILRVTSGHEIKLLRCVVY